jgi:serine/threonine protein kinase
LRKIHGSRILSIVPEAHAGMMVTPSVKLVRPLGEGGMGAVWIADHAALRTQVVVKFISSDLKDSKEAIERFSREAAAAAQVKSPHVVQTFDHGVAENGVPYIVMELLEGRDLGQFLDEHPQLPTDLAVDIVAQLARALDKAHSRGIVHRDIKPGNIFLCDHGKGEMFVKLLDFGIAKGVEGINVDSNTKTGAMIGSPFYMSPEQILGSKNLDHRSDLWSVGVVVFEALTGHKPFDAETMGGLAIRIHSEPLPLPSATRPELGPAVDAWFQRACERKVEARFDSAKEMAEALAAAVGGQMPRSIETPRVSTGSADVSGREPTLVAGATTVDGIARPTHPPAGGRIVRVAMVIGTVLILGPATYFGIRSLIKPSPAQGIVTSATTSAAPPTAAGSPATTTSTAPPVLLPVSATPPEVASAPPPPVHTTTARPGIGRPRPPNSGNTSSVTAPLPSAPPTSTVRPPATNDIF